VFRLRLLVQFLHRLNNKQIGLKGKVKIKNQKLKIKNAIV